jgi:hypothetical protein
VAIYLHEKSVCKTIVCNMKLPFLLPSCQRTQLQQPLCSLRIRLGAAPMPPIPKPSLGGTGPCCEKQLSRACTTGLAA